VKSWSSFAVGFVLGVAVAAVLFFSLSGGRGRAAQAASSGTAAMKSPADQAPAAGVVNINGLALTQRHQDEFVQRYGVAPVPGSYWYDAQSGLWGLAGQAAAGFLLPGHDYGTLAADASNGRTNIFLNGREMPQSEVLVFGALVGVILPGRYWLDGQGNFGYEGMPIPAGNLYVMAAANAGAYGGGGGGGGDNFWSSRFGRGNSNADNSMGYVSLPGGGTVTYGM